MISRQRAEQLPSNQSVPLLPDRSGSPDARHFSHRSNYFNLGYLGIQIFRNCLFSAVVTEDIGYRGSIKATEALLNQQGGLVSPQIRGSLPLDARINNSHSLLCNDFFLDCHCSVGK